MDYIIGTKNEHINHIDWTDLYKFKDQIDFSRLKKTINKSNHYNDKHNRIVYNSILNRIT